MNKLEEWERDDVITLELPEDARDEALSGTSLTRHEKAQSFISSEPLPSTPQERERLIEIEHILFPAGAATASEKRDVMIVFTADKYGAVLITNDGDSKRQPGGILGNSQLLAELQIRVMTDKEACEEVKRKIESRDNHARRYCQRTGKALPYWVGKD
ncbi:MAG: hypothetical protein ACPGYT_12135 [Nitrospirales bacterium]